MRFFGKSVRTPNMGSRLPILAVVGLLGAAGGAILVATGRVEPSQRPGGERVASQSGPEQGTGAPSISGQALLEHAILRLESRRSVSAKIRHSVDLFGQKPVGSGLYLERRSPRELQFRLEIRIQLGDDPSSLLHVCDGRYLWMYRKLGDSESLSRIDVARVQRALEESGDMGRMASIGQWPGLGGLPRLLRGLYAAFEFTSVEETRLAAQLPVWKLRGEWRKEKLARLLPEHKDAVKKGKLVNLSQLPEHLPDHVLVFLGRTDEFPYRIEYRRRKARPGKGEGISEDRSLVVMELFEVDLNAPIHPTRFLYAPGDLEYADETRRFLEEQGLGP